MAFAFVQGNHGQTFSGTSLGVTFGSAVTAGNTILVAWAVSATTLNISGIADGTNSYTVGTQTCTQGGTWKAGYGFANSIGSGTPTVTVTANGTVGGLQVWIEEWSGVAGSAFDGASATGTSGTGLAAQTFNAGSYTPTVNGDLIWAYGWNDGIQSAGCIIPGVGFTSGFDNTSTSGYISEFLTQSTATSINPSLITGTTGLLDLFAVSAAFKATGGGASKFPQILVLGVG